jgi:hypothetical protein
MADSISSLIELGVGAVCLLGAWASWRRLRSPLVSALLALAGLAALAHAVWALFAGG